MEIVILIDTAQDLEGIIGITLVIKIVGTRVAIWQDSIPITKTETQLNVMFVGQHISPDKILPRLVWKSDEIQEGNKHCSDRSLYGYTDRGNGNYDCFRFRMYKNSLQ